MSTNEIISEFISYSTHADFPMEVVQLAKQSVLDTIGNIIAAVHTRTSTIARSFVSQFTHPHESTLFGCESKVPCSLAAFANSIMASDLDADDGHRGAMGHPGAAIVPASLAFCEKDKLSGKEFVEAIVVGYEIATRMGIIANKNHRNQFIGSGHWVSFGVTAAVAKLMKIENSLNALGICDAHTPKAPMEWMFLGKYPMLKEAIGWGAFTGTMSALMADNGMQGTLWRCSDDLNVFHTLGAEFEFEKVYFKEHSSCRYTHPAINGVLGLKKNTKFKNEDIDQIRIGTFKFALNLDAQEPKNIQEAQYSIPFTVGAALAYGQVGPTEICEAMLSNQKILTLAKKVHLFLDADIQDQFPMNTLARIELKLTDGSILKLGPSSLKGDFKHPLTEEELEAKFRRFAGTLLKDEQLTEIICSCKDLEEIKSISNFVEYVGCAINNSL